MGRSWLSVFMIVTCLIDASGETFITSTFFKKPLAELNLSLHCATLSFPISWRIWIFPLNAVVPDSGTLYIRGKRYSHETLRVISRKTLVDFWTRHKDAEQPLKAWFKEAEKACWQSPDILKHRYPSASILNHNRVVFNIKGNKYRLITMINYDYGQVFIRFVGTHAEYETIDATTI